VLSFGSPQEIEAQVRENLQILGTGGGFIFCAVHNVQATVPTENLLALFRALAAYY
jgi:uroporphyrinogen decarboxylase